MAIPTNAPKEPSRDLQSPFSDELRAKYSNRANRALSERKCAVEFFCLECIGGSADDWATAYARHQQRIEPSGAHDEVNKFAKVLTCVILPTVNKCGMIWLRWIDDARSTTLALAALLLTGAVMSIGLIYNPSLLGRMPHHDMLYAHRGLAVGLLPLLFFRIPTRSGWTKNTARVLIILWLTYLALSALLWQRLGGVSLDTLRIAVCVAIAGFAGLRISSIGRDSNDASLDAACIIAVGIAFAGYLGWLLAFFLALCSIAKVSSRIHGGLAAACIACLASRLVAGLWVDSMWLIVFVSGLAVCVFAWKEAATSPCWNRRVSRLQVAMFLQALGVACFLRTTTTDVHLSDTLVRSSMAHLLWAVPVLGWLKLRTEPKNRVAWGAIVLLVLGYHLVAWSHFLLGTRGMPWGYFAYDDRFSFGFLLAGIGAIAVTVGAIVFLLWRRNQLPEACVV